MRRVAAFRWAFLRLGARSGCTRALIRRLGVSGWPRALAAVLSTGAGYGEPHPGAHVSPPSAIRSWTHGQGRLDGVEGTGLASRDALGSRIGVGARGHGGRRRGRPGDARNGLRPADVAAVRSRYVPRAADLRQHGPADRGEGRGRLGHARLRGRLPARRRGRLHARPPRRPRLRAAPCEANSPAFRVPGTAQVAIRVTDTVDGTQATRDAAGRRRARAGRQDRPGPARRDRRPVRAAPGRRAVRPRQRPQDERRRRQGPAQRLARGDRDPVEGARQRRAQEGRRPRQRRAAGPPRLRPPLRRRGQGHPLGRLGSRRTTTPTRRTSSTAAPATTGSIPAMGRPWSRPAPARTTSGPTTAAAPSTAARAQDTARVKLNGPWKLRNCERVLHFCAFGSDGHGGCLKPGEKKPTGQTRRGRAAWVAARAAR